MPDINNDGRDDRLDFPRPVAIVWPDPTNPFNRLGTPAVAADFAGGGGGSTPVGMMADGAAFAGVIKASAGTLYNLSVSNALGVNVYLRIYNQATTPTPGSQTPLLRYLIPPGGREIQIPGVGSTLTVGIAWSLTMGSFADTDVTPVTLNGASFNAMYK